MSATPAEIARRALTDHLAALPSAELLSRYASGNDPEAFAGLVQQFGPLVLGVCRRVLGSAADADDAFQAVFLALARQAGSFRDARALPAWLHRVALRVARKALARRAAEPLRGLTPPGLPEPIDPNDPFANVAWKDVRRVLDEELDALPQKVRGPVVLCWLDGLTQDEAAGRLGTSLNTLKRRLDAGRELLRARLTRRGLAPALVAAAVLDPTGLRAVLPDSLAVLAVEVGVPGATIASGVEMLEAAVSATLPTRRVALAAILGAGAVAAGGVVYALSRPPRPSEPEIPPFPQPGPQPVTVAPAPRPVLGPLQFELLGKPLPPADVVASLVFGRDGQTLISGGGGALQLWDIATGTMRTDHGLLRPDDFSPRTSRFIDAVLLSSDGKSVFTACSRRDLVGIYAWDLGTGKIKSVQLDFYDVYGTCAISPDGKCLAAVGGNLNNRTRISVFDVTPYWSPLESKNDPDIKRDWRGDSLYQKPRVVINYPQRGIHRLVFSPDGATLVLIDDRGEIQRYDTKTGQQKATFSNPGYQQFQLAFSPDGRFLASCATAVDGATIQVIDLATGTNHTLARQSGRGDYLGFSSLVFHPDGRSLVVGGWQEITWWDVMKREKLGAVKTDGGWVTCLAFNPDGSILASAIVFEKRGEARELRPTKLWSVSRQK